VSISGALAEILLRQKIAESEIALLKQRIEAAKQRLESLNGKQVGQAELYAVIEILEGKQ